ncbi:hypothetical protein BG011_006444 [Mortierella polycephala]|uniref:Mid2 domain-containing protein n=1 Tax=Mortierella polycephala TaxID=41804 RepID=A0A9P6PSR8_9FUNG|nr:hypothetical protein BG011_006444 [Mortierella polycephala]
MHIARLALLALLGTLLILNVFSLPAHANDHQLHNKGLALPHKNKRDLIGNLVGNAPDSQPPAAPPSDQTSPPPSPPAAPGSDPSAAKTNSTRPLPNLVGEVLNPPVLVNSGKAGSPTAGTSIESPTSKKNPEEDGEKDDAPGAEYNPNTPADEKAAADNSLSPGLIALVVVFVLAVLSAILFSCYRIRQSRRRRRQSWDEDILKNHAGSVGYSERAGYGIYVGGGNGKEKPDLWRKNLDLFHRE